MVRPSPPARARSGRRELRTVRGSDPWVPSKNTKSSRSRPSPRCMPPKPAPPARRFPDGPLCDISTKICALFSSLQAPRSHRLAKLLYRRQIRRQRLPVSELRCAITPFRVQEIQQARSAAFVGIFGDVARLLRRVEIHAAVQRNDLIVLAHAFVRVQHVAHDLIAGRELQFLRLI